MNVARKKMILVASYAPSLINFRGKLIESAIARGWDVVVMAPDFDAAMRDALQRLGANPLTYSLQRTGMNPVLDIKSLLSLYRIFCREKPDVVLSYTIKPVIYASLAARMAGVKSVYSMITGLGFSFSGKGWKQKIVSNIVSRLFRRALEKNKRVFFQNPDDRDFFESKAFVTKGQSVIINGSGVDVNHFIVETLPTEPQFLMIARLLKEKGVYEYIEAIRQVKKIYPDITCCLAGWIDDAPTAIKKKELDAWVADGLVCFLGKLSDVRPAIAACSIYVLPSYREGTPRTVLEAMAMGRAVITTDVPGCRETVKHDDNGLLVEGKSAQALADAMIELIENQSKVIQMGASGRRIAELKYDVHRVNASILDVILV
jgi:glycosyltransferase involved in cell wall biosynthesis